MLLFLGLIGCKVLTVEILSPEDGATFDRGEPVMLEATAESTEGPVTFSWTAEDWVVEDNGVAARTLPVGAYDLVVNATSGGLVASDTVSIEILPVPIDYTGILTVTADINNGAFEANCEHRLLEYVLEVDGSLAGSGRCYAFQDWDFTVDGQVEGTSLAGTMGVSGQTQTMAFTGTVAADGTMNATFDQVFTSDQGTIRLFGSFVATPE